MERRILPWWIELTDWCSRSRGFVDIADDVSHSAVTAAGFYLFTCSADCWMFVMWIEWVVLRFTQMLSCCSFVVVVYFLLIEASTVGWRSGFRGWVSFFWQKYFSTIYIKIHFFGGCLVCMWMCGGVLSIVTSLFNLQLWNTQHKIPHVNISVRFFFNFLKKSFPEQGRTQDFSKGGALYIVRPSARWEAPTRGEALPLTICFPISDILTLI